MKVQSLSRLLVGITIVVIGLGFLLQSLGIWEFNQVLMDWWPMGLIIIGAASLISNPRTWLWPLFLIAGGALLILGNLDVFDDFSAWEIFWPIALIVFGLSFLFERLTPQSKATEKNETDIFVMFSGVDSVNTSDTYEGGKITALFGGAKLDLRESDIKEKATLEVFTAFGGVELLVPEGWTVQASGLPIFGGWEDKTTRPKSAKAPKLEIRGTCLFGGVEIKHR